MPNMILARNRQQFTHSEWVNMPSEEKDRLLARYGPAYTQEAWNRHHNVKPKKFRR
jgi:hypothetical protein